VVRYVRELERGKKDEEEGKDEEKEGDKKGARVLGVSVESVLFETFDEASGARRLPESEREWRLREVEGEMKRKSRRVERVARISASEQLPAGKYTFNKARLFPTSRRPERRELSEEGKEVIGRWFEESGICLFEGLSDSQVQEARRILYTWRDVFEDDICKIRRTDLIEHAIDLVPGARPFRAKTPLWSDREMKFAEKLLPQMEQAGVICRFDGPWGHRTKFPPRSASHPEKGLRMVHNFHTGQQIHS
jgi:hypothetical protein